MLTRVAVIGALALAVVVATPAASEAATCGNASVGGGYRGQITDLTTKGVGCSSALAFARGFIRGGVIFACEESRGNLCTYRGWRCRTASSSASTSVRCTRGARVIRFR